MNRDILKEILDILQDLKKENKTLESNYLKMIKTMESISSMTKENSEAILKIEQQINNILLDSEKEKSIIQQINNSLSLLDGRIAKLEKFNDIQEIKKTLSSILYDILNFKNDLTKKISMLDNKILLIESKVNMKDATDIDSIQASISEVKDIVKISVQGINAKVTNLFERISSLEFRIKINEVMLSLATSSEKENIVKQLNELSKLLMEAKSKNLFERDLIYQISTMLENMQSYYKSSGQVDLAKIFMQKKVEIENM
ncbi:MAG: hypothetical protein QXO84_02425 [Candidatus Aenigmatarchaeota archaeon]